MISKCPLNYNSANTTCFSEHKSLYLPWENFLKFTHIFLLTLNVSKKDPLNSLELE